MFLRLIGKMRGGLFLLKHQRPISSKSDPKKQESFKKLKHKFQTENMKFGVQRNAIFNKIPLDVKYGFQMTLKILL